MATLPPERLESPQPSRARTASSRPESIRTDSLRPGALRPDPLPFPRPRHVQLQTVAAKRRRKLVGKLTLVSLLTLAVITGSLAGLTLVYSFDLPQIADLEKYRPSTTTDLYDQKGRIIGSFALERREVVGYDGFAPVLRQAVISIEDKSFASHWGVNVFRVMGAVWHDIRSKGRAQGASTLTMQLARNLFPVSYTHLTLPTN